MWPAAGPVSSAPTAVSTLAQRKTRMLNTYILYQTVMFHKEFLNVSYTKGHHNSVYTIEQSTSKEEYVLSLGNVNHVISQNHSVLKNCFLIGQISLKYGE